MGEIDLESTLRLSRDVPGGDLLAEFREDHVHVTIGPEYTLDSEQQEEFWERLRTICDAHSTKRVLVEGYVPADELDTGEVVEAGLRTAAIPQLWMAFHLANFVQSERSELFEKISASRGVRVKFFSDTEHALAWLRSNTPA
jgi:hypothetical protein